MFCYGHLLYSDGYGITHMLMWCCKLASRRCGKIEEQASVPGICSSLLEAVDFMLRVKLRNY